MNLDELQSVQSRERQASGLQNLRASFYAEAAEFVGELREQRKRVIDEEGIDSPEFERLSDDIRTAERAVESIYERRVGKVVKKASIAAADMPTDEDGLTKEERALFETLVDDIRDNRARVLDALDDGGAGGTGPARGSGPADGAATGDAGTPPAPDHEPGADRDGVGAADVMGGGERAAGAPDGPPSASGADPSGTGDGEPPVPDLDGAAAGGEDPTGGDVERTTVRITRDVGEILGVDERAYQLASEDVVTLPRENAEPLLRRDAAERID